MKKFIFPLIALFCLSALLFTNVYFSQMRFRHRASTHSTAASKTGSHHSTAAKKKPAPPTPATTKDKEWDEISIAPTVYTTVNTTKRGADIIRVVTNTTTVKVRTTKHYILYKDGHETLTTTIVTDTDTQIKTDTWGDQTHWNVGTKTTSTTSIEHQPVDTETLYYNDINWSIGNEEFLKYQKEVLSDAKSHKKDDLAKIVLATKKESAVTTNVSTTLYVYNLNHKVVRIVKVADTTVTTVPRTVNTYADDHNGATLGKKTTTHSTETTVTNIGNAGSLKGAVRTATKTDTSQTVRTFDYKLANGNPVDHGSSTDVQIPVKTDLGSKTITGKTDSSIKLSNTLNSSQVVSTTTTKEEATITTYTRGKTPVETSTSTVKTVDVYTETRNLYSDGHTSFTMVDNRKVSKPVVTNKVLDKKNHDLKGTHKSVVKRTTTTVDIDTTYKNGKGKVTKHHLKKGKPVVTETAVGTPVVHHTAPKKKTSILGKVVNKVKKAVGAKHH